MSQSELTIYLQNHEAAARAGVGLFRRAARGQRRRAWGPELATLSEEVSADLRQLQTLMKTCKITANPLLGLALSAGEILGRAKPNGRLIRRAPLSDLFEVEALLDAVHAKQRGWTALLEVDTDLSPNGVDLTELHARAEQQQQRLDRIHRRVAADVLAT